MGPFTKISTVQIVGTSYIDINVAAGQSYTWVVWAVDQQGNASVFSAPAQGTIPPDTIGSNTHPGQAPQVLYVAA